LRTPARSNDLVVHPRQVADHRKTHKSVFSQDPTAYRSVHPALSTPFHAPEDAVLTVATTERLASQHPLMSPPSIKAGVVLTSAETFAPNTGRCSLERR